MDRPGPDEHSRRIAAESLAERDPTGWFERLYAAAEQGEAVVPWDRGAPHALLVQWARERGLEGAGRRALVVGCGLGDDAEFVAGLGFDTLAFDVSPTAVRAAHGRFPGSRVRYVVADLLDPPAEWRGAFDLVVEIITVQSLPEPPRRQAIANVACMVGAGGTLVVIATGRDAEDEAAGPPWPLTRAEVDAFASERLEAVQIEDLREPGMRRWRAEFRAVA
ncbi:MAG TPA: class I SAM-dependent methyltransferase [Solirubrobacteraceae bacterium]|nr:class I SAM-dependent methyltransferase [Solirubrobacteraceae bacterium]